MKPMTQGPTQMNSPVPRPMPSPAPMSPGVGHTAAPSPMPVPPMPAPAPQIAPQPVQPQISPQPQSAMPQMQPGVMARPQTAPSNQSQMVAPQQGTPMGMPIMSNQPYDLDPEINKEGGDRALPQISIHAFCDRQESASIINETTRDWRMKRTNVKIYMGGLPSAIDFYHKENTPSLILIESGMRGQELFAQLEQLASVCDEGTKVVMIGAANDIRLYRQLIDKGISDYLVPPFHPINLIRSLGELYSDPEKPFTGRVAAFFGAKGGVGSSTIAHNIAWCLSEIVQQETILVDLDASWGTTGLDFAYDASQGLEEALAEPERLDETLLDRILIRHTPKLSILPTQGTLQRKPVLDPAAYEAVIDGIRSISPLSILDMPHQWMDWTTNVLTNVDDVVVTTTPDLASLRNTKNLIDFLRAERPNDSDPVLILNKTGMSKTGEIAVKDFSAAVGLEPALVLGFDPDAYLEAANDGKMLTDVKAAAQAVNGLNYIAQRLKTGQFDSGPSVNTGRGGSLIGKLSGKGKKDSGSKSGKSLFSLKKKEG